jgi:hypothetical protein
MGRKPKTNRVPRTRAGGEWTEAAFWQFIRSGLRKLSQRWPPMHKAVESRKRPNQSSNKKFKWEYQCDRCQQWFYLKQVERDHIIPCGSLTSFDDIGPFVERMLCEIDGWGVLCVKCHRKRTNEK